MQLMWCDRLSAIATPLHHGAPLHSVQQGNTVRSNKPWKITGFRVVAQLSHWFWEAL